MKKICFILSVSLLLLVFSCGRQPRPPVAEKIPFVVESNGNERVDNYFWMRLSDEQKNAEIPDSQTVRVLAYLNAENDYSKAVMKHTEKMQKNLFEELKGRLKEDDESVPYLDNGYYYHTKYFPGKEYPVYFRKKEGSDKPEVMLDVNLIAEGHEYTGVGGASVSPDNNLLAYGVDHVSRRQYTIHFKDLNSGELIEDTIVNTTGQGVFAADSRTFFYISKDPETLRAATVMMHILGTPSSADKVVFYEDDETFSLGLGRTKSKKFITIVSHHTLSTEVRLIESASPEKGFRVFEARGEDHLYSIDHLYGTFYILTNAGSAPNFKLMTCPEQKTDIASWKEVIPHRPEVLLADFELFNDFLVIDARIKALTNLRIINLSDK